MPRAAGQIDAGKTKAILDAAQALFAEKGALASMDEIARRAGVSKQTLYNRFASRLEIGRALASRRSDAISAPLRDADGEPEDVLAGLALRLLEKVLAPDAAASMRGVALTSPETPELAAAVYDAGPAEGLRRLAAWLVRQDAAGRLKVPDPVAAAEMFVGMALGHAHLRAVLGVPHPATDREARAREAARRFARAFAP